MKQPTAGFTYVFPRPGHATRQGVISQAEAEFLEDRRLIVEADVVPEPGAGTTRSGGERARLGR